MLRTTFSVALLLVSTLMTAQHSAPEFFQPVASAGALPQVAPGDRVFPEKYTTWRLDLPALQQNLSAAPREFTPAARQGACRLAVPRPDGSMETFAIWQIDLMHPDLAARHPYIRVYAGRSLADPSAILRMSVTARGFRAMILRAGGGAEFVQPYVYGQTEYYLAFDRADEAPSPLASTERLFVAGELPPPPDPALYAPGAEPRGTLLEPLEVKVYRFAVATTGEFAQDHGGTVATALSAVVEYTNEVSGVFERDLTLRLQLIADNDEIIYTNPNTDAYSGGSVGAFATTNDLVIPSVIGNANFDIGHVYARYPGGSASGVVQGGIACGQDKANACSSGNGFGDYGSGFLGTIAQEVGHQYGGGHTWNRCGSTNGRDGNSAYEPGSGSTIMSYSSCGSDNVQGYSDLYFHGGSIGQITNYVINGFANACGFYTPTDNTVPTVTHPYQDNFFIPISTPFELTGSANDPDGDAVTYCWEEIDTGPETPLQTPVGSSPLFRTRPAVDVPNRYFPRLSTVLANGFDVTEQLPTYSRDLTFRLTARDNRSGGGGVAWADVAFRAAAEAGPFVVTSPNSAAAVWKIGEFTAVTWDVANTNLAPVSCQLVDILLSTDGGQTWPTVLSAATGNDGIQYVLVPDMPSTQARVRVRAADNVFYDVSNANFRIEQPAQPGFSMSVNTNTQQACLPAVLSTEIYTNGTLGFSDPLSLDLLGELPPGATAVFSTTTLTPGQSSTLTFDLSNVTVEGSWTLSVRAWAAGTDTLTQSVTLNTTTNDFSALALLSPADGSTGLSQSQTLRWQAVPDANTYDVQFANSPSFDTPTILATKTNTTVDTFKVPIFLEKGKGYYWRVRPGNECGKFDWTEPFFFSTYVENCQTWEANDVPQAISSNNASTIEAHINVGADVVISDLNVEQVSGYHNEFGQLDATLISPAGTQVILFKNRCGVISVPFDMTLDDAALTNFTCPPATLGNAVKPQNPLTPLIGQSSMGQWKLRIHDNLPGAGGTLQGFRLEFCAAASLNPPFLLTNNAMSIESGTNQAISPAFLQASDPNNTAQQLVFTLVTAPQFGRLEKNWGGEMAPGDQFTQADLDNGAIRYFDYGGDLEEDYFRFTVTDGESGFFGTPKFVIQPFSVGTVAPAALDFALYPNPAQETLWLALPRPAESEVRIGLVDVAGRFVQTGLLPAGSDRVALPVAALPKGIYAVRIESREGSGVRKVVIGGGY